MRRPFLKIEIQCAAPPRRWANTLAKKLRSADYRVRLAVSQRGRLPAGLETLLIFERFAYRGEALEFARFDWEREPRDFDDSPDPIIDLARADWGTTAGLTRASSLGFEP